ncbi:hypothetical protein K492DRAFT_200091 [Lichtheimia hyalospora FSU 10163]|nr:hypothetical protein K492DRAFT_200091 [Lichtheimia hyalospora FSU 10163]
MALLPCSDTTVGKMDTKEANIYHEQLHASGSQGQHSQVIEQSIVISQGLVDLHQNVLGMRARSIHPSSELVDLCPRHVHLEEGPHIAACHVGNKALKHVDKSDPSYDTILTTKAMAMNKTKSPFFTHSNYRQQLEYIIVSTTGWHRITESITFYQYNRHCFFDERDNKVFESFKHVQSLVDRHYKSSTYQLFAKYNFMCLTSLTVADPAPENLHRTMPALKFIGKGLPGLSLYCETSMNRVVK